MDDLGTEDVGGGLQRGDVVDREKGIVGFAKAEGALFNSCSMKLWP
jgi:hypothetical protein